MQIRRGLHYLCENRLFLNVEKVGIKMNLIDAHAHLMDEKFDGEVEKIINNAQEAGVTKIINIGYNKETSQKAIELAEKYDFIYATIGLHPEELETEQDIIFIKEM